MSRSLAILSAASCALLTSCAHYSQEDGERLANEVFALQSQIKALQGSMSETQKLARDHEKKISEIEKELDDLSLIARRNDANIGAELDRMREELARTRGVASRLEALETKLNQVADNFALSEEKAKTGAEAQRSALELERLMGDPDALFKKVISLINDKKAVDARAILREFSKRAEERSRLKKYRAQIQFFIAETYFTQGKYQLAATEYNVVRKKFPKSKWVPDALYKLGMCFERLNLPDDAKLFYSQVRKKYSKSSAAKKAKARLRALK